MINPKEKALHELKASNPWNEVADMYVGSEFFHAPETTKFVCRKDKEYLDKFNESLSVDEKKWELFRYHLNCPVYPWEGNPLKAKVIILTLNPAYADRVERFGHLIKCMDSKIVNEYADHQRASLRLEADSMYARKNGDEVSSRDVALFHGCFYWYNRIKRAMEDEVNNSVVTEEEMDKYLKNVAIMEFVGYTSVKYKSLPKGRGFPESGLLPSQEFTLKLIEYILQHNPETRFLILRAQKEWERLLDKTMKKYKSRFIIAQNRAQYFGRHILKDNYASIAALIKQ